MNTYKDYCDQVKEDFNGPGMFVIYELFESEHHQRHVPAWEVRKLGEQGAMFAEEQIKRGKRFVHVCNNDMVITAMRIPVKEGRVTEDAIRFIVVKEKNVKLKDCEIVTMGKDGGFSHWPKGFCDEYANMSLELL